MFTGIITDIGEVVHVEGNESLRRFRIATRYEPESIAIGASIAHAGICLTVIHKGHADHGRGDFRPLGWFEVEAAAETLRLTKAGTWQVGTKLNLERAMKIGDELGGHIVTGHVDGLAEVVTRDEVTRERSRSEPVRSTAFSFSFDAFSLREPVPTSLENAPEADNWGATARFTLRVPRPLHRFIAQKGSVTLDGTSLTVNDVEDDQFSVLLIPHTLQVTTWGAVKAGDAVHLEVDLMARYAARLAGTA